MSIKHATSIATLVNHVNIVARHQIPKTNIFPAKDDVCWSLSDITLKSKLDTSFLGTVINQSTISWQT